MESEPTLREQPGSHSISRRDVIPILVIALTAIVLVLPIFLRGFPAGADIRHHYKWSYYFFDGLREGSLYPRWLAGANRGYGSPVMFYYPPLAFYAAAAFNALTGNLLLAIKLSCGLSMIASGLSMYVFGGSVLSRTASVGAAVMYMAAPYHIFELYRVNALSEYWALVWIPLVFDAVRRIAWSEGWRACAYLGLSYGLLLVTHIPASFIFTAILPVFVLALTRDRSKLIKIASGVALGIGLSAFYLVSVVFETKYVHIDRILGNSYVKAFLFEDFSALSWTNLLSAANYPRVAGYVREANLVAVAYALLLGAASVVLLLERRSLRENRSRMALVRAIWLVAIASLLMTTRITDPLWSTFQNLQYLQSPIRWLVPATAATALLGAISFQSVAGARWQRIVLAGSLGAAVAVNLAISMHITTQRSVDPDELVGRLLQKDVPEYTPLWWDSVFQQDFERSSVIIVEGETEVRAIDDAGLKQTYEVSTRTDATLKFRSLWFPGWAARVDGQRVDIGRSTEGNIQISVPPGSHVVVLRFETTWRHIKADVLSGVSVLILAAVFYSTRRSTIRPVRSGKDPRVENAPVHHQGSDYPA